MEQCESAETDYISEIDEKTTALDRDSYFHCAYGGELKIESYCDQETTQNPFAGKTAVRLGPGKYPGKPECKTL